MEQIQKAILNTIITEPKKRNMIFKELDEKYFDNHYKTIFNACKKRHSNKQDIDPVILAADLDKSYFNIILNIASDTNYYSAFDEYIGKLKEYYCRTQVYNELQLINNDIGNSPLPELRKKIIDISKLLNIDIEKHNITDMKKGLLEAFERLSQKKNYFKTGFSKLDKHLLISPGDYIIIGGRPSAGKTTFAINLMLKMSANQSILFFSFETSQEKVYDKILSITGGVNYSDILNANVYDDGYSKILVGIDRYKNNKFEVVQASGMNVEDIRNIAIEKQADIIFIDYIGLIEKRNMGNNLYEQMTNVSNRLHNIAQSDKLTIFALTQLNRTADNKEPTMADIRDSGAIEQDADAIIFLHNPRNNDFDSLDDTRLLKLSKNKIGSTGDINYRFYGKVQKFYEL